MYMRVLRCLRALADETRLRMYNILSDHELTVNEIVRVLQMGQSRVSRHLKIMADGELLVSRREGSWVHYTIRRDPASEKLTSAVTEMLGSETQAVADLERARAVVRERHHATQQFFDRIAESWEDLKKHILGDLDLNSILCRMAEECDTAVDVGCGTGDLLVGLREHSKRAIGVDSSPKMLGLARRRFSSEAGLQFRLGEAEFLPLRDAEADLAVMSLVLHHLSDPECGLSEVNRVLEPHGTFILADLEAHAFEFVRDRYGDRWLGFDPQSLTQLLSTSGFDLRNQECFQLQQGLRLHIYISTKIQERSKNNAQRNEF